MRLTLSLLCVSVTAILAGCASGGGSFDLDNVVPPATQNGNNTPQAPTYSDDTTGGRRDVDTAMSEPALGYMVEIPRLENAHQNIPVDDPRSTADITPDKVKAINYKLNQFPDVFSDIIEEHEKYNDEGVEYSHDKKNKYHTRNLKYVISGYVIGERTMKWGYDDNGNRTQEPAGQIGYVFYQGTNPAKALPNNLTVTYNGTWDFTSNAKKSRSTLPEGFTQDNLYSDATVVGSRTGATTLQANINRGGSRSPTKDAQGNEFGIGQTSEFTVNFGDKSVKGSLKSNGYVASANSTQSVKERYTIDGTVKGNRFTGTATAKDANHEIFGKNSSTVEGGFFGDNAEELGGKFLTDDNSLFVVFAGKRDAVAGDTETKFDAVSLDRQNHTKTNLDTFGNIAYLVLDGKQIPLLPDGKTRFADMDFNQTIARTLADGRNINLSVCCNNLDYVKFGTYSIDGGDGQYYLLGERTAVSDMPTTGTVHYRGTWDGFITAKDGRVWSTSPSNKESGSRTRFDFDFGNKSFTGALIANNGLEDKPTFSLTGNIIGNGFTGKAVATDFNLDSRNSNGGARVNINADISGGFYGPKASEIGGTILANEDGKDKISGVFGGKRQIKQ